MTPTFKRTGLILTLCLTAGATAAHAAPDHPFEQAEPSEFRNATSIAVQFMLLAAKDGIRGTHSKGACVSGEFEMKDLAQDVSLPESVRNELRRGFFAKSGDYPARIRFANAASAIQPDKAYDPRAVSISLDLGNGRRQDFVLQNAPIFPIPNMKDFALAVRTARKHGDKSTYNENEKRRIAYVEEKAKVFPADVSSYRTQTYWSETAYALGDDAAAKYVMVPCAENSVHGPSGSGENFLQQDLANSMSAGDKNCFDFRVQILRPDAMTLNGEKIDRSRWVEDPTLEWKESEAPSYSVGKLRLANTGLWPAEDCDAHGNRISVSNNTDEANRPIGRINRGRESSESKSSIGRAIHSTVSGAWESLNPMKWFRSSDAAEKSAGTDAVPAAQADVAR